VGEVAGRSPVGGGAEPMTSPLASALSLALPPEGGGNRSWMGQNESQTRDANPPPSGGGQGGGSGPLAPAGSIPPRYAAAIHETA